MVLVNTDERDQAATFQSVLVEDAKALAWSAFARHY
jgi:hypothetical protein